MDTARRIDRTGPTDSQQTQSRRVQWRPVVIFVVLTYGIAWAFWAPVWPHALHALTTWRTATAYSGGKYAAFGMFAPAAAALIMRMFVSKEGLRGSLGPALRWRHYLVAVFGMAALVMATVGISVAIGLGEFSRGIDKPLWYILLLLLIVGTPVSAVLALGEEYGWRGYLLPKLLPLGEVKASVIVALVWAPWHLPLLLAGLNYVGDDPLLVLGFMTATSVGLSLLFTRMFVAAGGSVLVTAFMHGSLNSFSDRLSDSAHLSGNQFVVSVGGLIGLGMIALAVLIAYGVRRLAVRKTAGSPGVAFGQAYDGHHIDEPPSR